MSRKIIISLAIQLSQHSNRCLTSLSHIAVSHFPNIYENLLHDEFNTVCMYYFVNVKKRNVFIVMCVMGNLCLIGFQGNFILEKCNGIHLMHSSSRGYHYFFEGSNLYSRGIIKERKIVASIEKRKKLERIKGIFHNKQRKQTNKQYRLDSSPQLFKKPNNN